MFFEIDVLEMQLKVLDFLIAEDLFFIKFFHYHSICPWLKLMIKNSGFTVNARIQECIQSPLRKLRKFINSRKSRDHCKIEFEINLFRSLRNYFRLQYAVICLSLGDRKL